VQWQVVPRRGGRHAESTLSKLQATLFTFTTQDWMAENANSTGVDRESVKLMCMDTRQRAVGPTVADHRATTAAAKPVLRMNQAAVCPNSTFFHLLWICCTACRIARRATNPQQIEASGIWPTVIALRTVPTSQQRLLVP